MRTMDLIVSYMSNKDDDDEDDDRSTGVPHSPTSVDDLSSSGDEALLARFFRLFVSMKTRYETVVGDMKRLEAERKAELAKFEDYVHRAKSLSDERELLTIQFKEENDELIERIHELESQLAAVTAAAAVAANQHSDDEATSWTEMASNNEQEHSLATRDKIAALVADRVKLVARIDELSSALIRSTSATAVDVDKVEQAKHVNEVNTQTELNSDAAAAAATVALAEVDENTVNSSSDDDSNERMVDALRCEVSSVRADNVALKLEVEKLYDEIGTFELDAKHLRDDNAKLKQEIDALNNELDELVAAYKAKQDAPPPPPPQTPPAANVAIPTTTATRQQQQDNELTRLVQLRATSQQHKSPTAEIE